MGRDREHVAVAAQASVVLAETLAETLYRLGPRTEGPVPEDGSIGRLTLRAGVGSNAEMVVSNSLGDCVNLLLPPSPAAVNSYVMSKEVRGAAP